MHRLRPFGLVRAIFFEEQDFFTHNLAQNSCTKTHNHNPQRFSRRRPPYGATAVPTETNRIQTTDRPATMAPRRSAGKAPEVLSAAYLERAGGKVR